MFMKAFPCTSWHLFKQQGSAVGQVCSHWSAKMCCSFNDTCSVTQGSAPTQILNHACSRDSWLVVHPKVKLVIILYYYYYKKIDGGGGMKSKELENIMQKSQHEKYCL